MTTTLKQDYTEGFVELYISSDENVCKAIARLWNNGDCKKENKNWSIVISSGKGFYDGSAEFIVQDKNTHDCLLCTAHTNYGGRNWKSPDYVTVKGIQVFPGNIK